MSTLSILLEKEFKQIRRNPIFLRLSVLMPFMIMLIMPLVTTMDVKHVNIAIVDRDGSATSQRIINDLGSSEYFTICLVTSEHALAFDMLEQGSADAMLEIPYDFEKLLTTGSPQISILANGVNAQKGSIGMQYITGAVGQSLMSLRESQGLTGDGTAAEITITNHYNPTLDYQSYMIPALMIMLLVLICGFMPALNLVTEKEIGTIEQINVSPVGKFQFALAKLIPFWIIGLIALAIGMVVAFLVYGLSPLGGLGAVYLASIFFIFTMTGVGVVIANYSNTLQQTMFVMFFFVLIFMLMSGLMTPVTSMPDWAQSFSYILPPRYYVDIMRAIYLKGATISDLWLNQYVPLIVFAFVFDTWAALSYRKRS